MQIRDCLFRYFDNLHSGHENTYNNIKLVLEVSIFGLHTKKMEKVFGNNITYSDAIKSMIDDYEPEKICADLFVEFKDLTYSWSHMDIQCNANQVYSSSTRAVSKDALTSYYNEMQDVYKKDKIKIFDENFGGQSKDNVGLALTCLLILTFMYFIISIQ